MKPFSFLLFPILFLLFPLSGNTQILSDTIFAPDTIKTVLLHKENSNLSLPIIPLNTNEKLVLSFDELSESVTTNYKYKILYCNEDWTLSELRSSEYINGFEEGYINTIQFSFNTTQPYVHYELTFPDEMQQFKVSGNYVITVFPEDSPEQPIFRKQFRVYESLTTITGEVKHSAEDRSKKQELELSISTRQDNPLFVSNPKTDLRVYVQQNGRKDNIHKLPLYNIRGNTYNYKWSTENIFNGGNEFRNFDIRSLRNRTRYIREINYFGGEYHTYLLPDKERARQPYVSDDDINGKFYIHADDRDNSAIESDYGWVYFSLPMNQLRIDGRYYILGQLTNWTIGKESQLQWNTDEKAYQARFYLKQGYYNYQIVFVHAGTKTGDETVFEGNHFETENDYHIFVYFRQFGDTHDRLVGFSTVKSR